MVVLGFPTSGSWARCGPRRLTLEPIWLIVSPWYKTQNSHLHQRRPTLQLWMIGHEGIQIDPQDRHVQGRHVLVTLTGGRRQEVRTATPGVVEADWGQIWDWGLQTGEGGQRACGGGAGGGKVRGRVVCWKFKYKGLTLNMYYFFYIQKRILNWSKFMKILGIIS